MYDDEYGNMYVGGTMKLKLTRSYFKTHLQNTQKIEIVNTTLKEFPEGVFEPLKHKLFSLKIDDNRQLEKVPKNLISVLSKLRRFYYTRNPDALPPSIDWCSLHAVSDDKQDCPKNCNVALDFDMLFKVPEDFFDSIPLNLDRNRSELFFVFVDSFGKYNDYRGYLQMRSKLININRFKGLRFELACFPDWIPIDDFWKCIARSMLNDYNVMKSIGARVQRTTL